jgi:putative hydrolase of the HAD superfamily
MPGADKAIVFDVGNVLIHVDFEKVFHAWAEKSGLAVDHVRGQFKVDDPYQQHERGKISASQYFSYLRARLGVDLTDECFIQGWNAVLLQQIEGMYGLLRTLQGHVPLYVFSNTNHTHLQYWLQHYSDLVAVFDKVFASCEICYRKPEYLAYQQVTSQIGINPGQIFFIDDLEENVRGAREAGMQALLFQSAAETKKAIADFLGQDQPSS